MRYAPTLLHDKERSIGLSIRSMVFLQPQKRKVANSVVSEIADCQWLSVTVASLGGAGGGRTAPGDTLLGVTPEGKKFFMGKFTKNSGETRSDR